MCDMSLTVVETDGICKLVKLERIQEATGQVFRVE